MSLILKTWNVTLNRDRPGLEDFWVKWEKLDHLWVETNQWTVTFILNSGHRLENTPQLQIVPAWALRCCYAASGQCRNKRNDKKVKVNPSWGEKTKHCMEVKPYVCTAQICILEGAAAPEPRNTSIHSAVYTGYIISTCCIDVSNFSRSIRDNFQTFEDVSEIHSWPENQHKWSIIQPLHLTEVPLGIFLFFFFFYWCFISQNLTFLGVYIRLISWYILSLILPLGHMSASACIGFYSSDLRWTVRLQWYT